MSQQAPETVFTGSVLVDRRILSLGTAPRLEAEDSAVSAVVPPRIPGPSRGVQCRSPSSVGTSIGDPFEGAGRMCWLRRSW